MFELLKKDVVFFGDMSELLFSSNRFVLFLKEGDSLFKFSSASFSRHAFFLICGGFLLSMFLFELSI